MARLSQVFVPKDREFFDLFEEAALNISRAGEMLEEMLSSFPEKASLARDILLAEQEGDRITHDIFSRLNQTFVTPIDREDIILLASALDDVVDLTEEAADYLILYKIEAPMEQAQRLACILRDACRQVAAAMPRMRSFEDISHFTVEIHRLENEGDRIVRAAMADLFSNSTEAVEVVKWKDVYALLEDCIDKCEDVANIIEKIVVKHA